jgi:lysophospholipase L1-like esterase
MSDQIRQEKIVGSRRFSNYFWGTFLLIGGISFLLAGISSYLKINLLPITDLSTDRVHPTGNGYRQLAKAAQ